MRISFLIVLILVLGELDLVAQYNISGKITNEEGQPIVNASVGILGTFRGTFTDENGDYLLDKYNHRPL